MAIKVEYERAIPITPPIKNVILTIDKFTAESLALCINLHVTYTDGSPIDCLVKALEGKA